MSYTCLPAGLPQTAGPVACPQFSFLHLTFLLFVHMNMYLYGDIPVESKHYMLFILIFSCFLFSIDF